MLGIIRRIVAVFSPAAAALVAAAGTAGDLLADSGGWAMAEAPPPEVLLAGTADVAASGGANRFSGGTFSPSAPSRSSGQSSEISASLLAEPSERISDLARSLDYDWRKCFRFVRDEIAFVPYCGFSRGADRTLLDRAGGDADQALLLWSLLRASGHDDATIMYLPAVRDENKTLLSGVRFPFRNYDGAHPYNVASWLGMEVFDDDTNTQVQVSSQLSWGDLKYAWNRIGRVMHVGVERFWVRLSVPDDETRNLVAVDLDPAFKPSLPARTRDVLADSGLSLSSILSAVGGTTNDYGCAALDATALDALLSTNSLSLCRAWGGTSAPCANYVSGPKIVPFSDGDSCFPGEIVGEPRDLSALDETTLSQFVVPVSLSVGDGAAFSAFLHEIGTHRFDVRFSSVAAGDPGAMIATIERDGVAISAETNATTAVKRTWHASVGHPRHPYSASSSFSAATNYFQCLVFAFDGFSADGLVVESSQLADAAQNNVECRNLAAARLAGDGWQWQSGQVGRLWTLVTGVSLLRLYNFGFSEFSGAPVINMPVGMSKRGEDLSRHYAAPLFTSALEHSLIEQMRGTSGTGAVSTVRLLSLSNANGESVHAFGPDTPPEKVSSLLDHLHDYHGSSRTEVSNWLARGWSVLAPASGDLGLGAWHGVGYWGHGQHSATTWTTTMRISGGLHGGYDSSPGEWTGADIERAPLSSASPDAAVAATTAADPVDLASGALLDSATDLTLPGLAWTRSYDSRARFSAGDLGRGWFHPFEASVSFGTDPIAAFGGGSVGAAAPTLVAMAAANALVQSSTNLPPGETARRRLAAALVADWWTRRLAGGTALVRSGASSLRFTVMPDGSFSPYPGVTAALSRTQSGGFALEYHHGDTWLFDSAGRLRAIRDRSGNETSVVRDASGRVSRVESSFGFAFDMARDSAGRVSAVSDGAGRSVFYAYDDFSRITNVVDAAGQSWPISIDPDVGAIAEKRSPTGALLLHNAFDSQGRVTNQVSATGGSWRFGYAGRGAWSEGPDGARETFSFDDSGRALSRADALGAVTRFERDSSGRIVRATDALGTETHLAYDESGDLIRIRDTATDETLARETAFSRDELGRVVAVTNALGAVTRFAYDSCDRQTAVSHPDGTTVSNEWTETGLLSAQSLLDSSGAVLRRDEWTHSPSGLPVTRTTFGVALPDLGVTERFAWDSAGNLVAFTDALGHSRRWAYDALGRVTNATDATGAQTRLTYGHDGNLSSVTDPLGRTASFSWNADGSLAAAMRPSGVADSFAYDALGRLSAITNALGAVSSVVRDSNGRIVLAVDPLGGETDFARDPLGRVTDSLDPIRRHRAARYDALGRMVRSLRPSGATESFGYDALDNLVAVTNSEDHVYFIARDALGRAVAATNAVSEPVYSASWSPLGLASRTDGRGVRLDFSRDAFGRVAAIAEGGTNTLAAFSRDAVGNVVAASNANVRQTFSYDGAGRLAAASTEIPNGPVFAFSFSRDVAGAITNSSCTPGFSIARSYDIDGNLVALSDSFGHAWTFSRDDLGRRTAIHHPGGAIDTTSYDLCGRVTAWSVADAHARTLSRNAAGECEEECVTVGPAPAPQSTFRMELEFDAADRPTAGTLRDGTGGVPQSVAFQHDGAGALSLVTISGTNNLAATHDAFGLPHSISDFTGTTETFLRDAFGTVVRTETSPPGDAPNARLWIPDPSDPLRRPVLECDAIGGVVRMYIWAEDRLLGFIDAATGSLTLAHEDFQGSVVALTDSTTGEILHQAAYSPFGENWGRAGTNPTPFAWLGAWGVRSEFPSASSASGATPAGSDVIAPFAALHLTSHRLYSPALRRFLSPDPLGPAGGINLYAYANNDPLSYIDPLGLCPEDENQTHAYSATIGGRIAIIGGLGGELGFVWDSNTDFGIIATGEIGFGVETSAKLPLVNRLLSSRFSRILDNAGFSMTKQPETIYDYSGGAIQAHGSFFAGIGADLENPAITGLEIGGIGGGVYASRSFIFHIGNAKSIYEVIHDAFDDMKMKIKYLIAPLFD